MAGVGTKNIIGLNNNVTTGENETSPSADIVSNLLKVETGPIVKIQDQFYNNNLDAGTGVPGLADGIGGSGKITYGTDSMFNPFYVFRFAKYGAIAGETYSADLHTDVGGNGKMNMLEGGQAQNETTSALQVISQEKSLANNPSASQIIKWAESLPVTGSKETTVAPYPYQWNDFLWCKWYGKIPNNRLLTLRRYPIPVEDNIQIKAEKGPLVPIAQAVTWWGEETTNSLDNVLGMTWGFPWEERKAGIQDITGNEINADTLLNAAAIEDPTLRRLLLASLFTGENNPFAGTGYDDAAQDWVRNSYTTGPYWNRVLGPINVIDSTQIRSRGYDWTHQITLNFAYKLRTFNNINPKIAMLDLITNFLALTHNKAEFWGGGIRYFQKTGYLMPGLTSKKFEEGDFIGGILEVLSQMVALVQGKAKELSESAAMMAKGIKAGELEEVTSRLETSAAVQNMAGGWIKDLMQKPLSIRSFLDGRATGEWHLTVGNPMNPLAVIGNLCLKSTTISFSDSLGMDDFPTEVKFTVTLDHGRPRAKQDIESMFNLGGGDMSFTAMPPPSSAFNSLGERNSITANNFNARGVTAPSQQAPSATFVATTGTNLDDPANRQRDTTLSNLGKAAYFTLNVARAYGVKWAQSPAIPDYFDNIKTKD